MATVLCCLGLLANAYVDIQQNNCVVSNSISTENSVGSHDDSLDDDQLEPMTESTFLDVFLIEFVSQTHFILNSHFTRIDWQPPKF